MRAHTLVCTLALGATLGASSARADWQSFEKGLHESPSVEDARALWRGAKKARAAGPLDNDLLVCRLRASAERHWDAFRAPDLLLRADFGDGRERWRAAPDNEHVAYVTLPAVNLKRGAELRFVVEDRDITGNERVGSGGARWDGALPISIEDDLMSVSCRVVDKRRVARGVEQGRAALERWHAGIARVVPDAQAEHIGAPFSSFVEGRQLVWRLGAWRGLRDPEVQREKKRLERIEGAHDARVRELVREQIARVAKKTGAARIGGGPEVRALRSDCRKVSTQPQPRCGVLFELTNPHAKTLRLSWGRTRASLYDKRGMELGLTLDLDERTRPAQRSLAPGEKLELFAWNLSLPDAPFVAERYKATRLWTPRGAAWLAVPPGSGPRAPGRR
jgi:hypothetical protein